MGWYITVKPDGSEYINHNGAFFAGAAYPAHSTSRW